MRRPLLHTKVTVKLRKSIFREEWYLYIESYPVRNPGSTSLRVVIDYINNDASIILKASILDMVLYDAAKICREIPEAEAMAEDTFIDDRNYLRFNDVLDKGIQVFLAGRGSGFRWWRHIKRYALARKGRRLSRLGPPRYAHAKHYPGNMLKRSLSK